MRLSCALRQKSVGRRAECASFAHSANGYSAYQKRRSETAPGSFHANILGQSHSDLQKIQIIPRKMVVGRNAPLFTTLPKKRVGRRAECASLAHSANGYAAYQKRRSETAPGSCHANILGQSHSDLQKIQIIPRKIVVWRNAPLLRTPPVGTLSAVWWNAPLLCSPPMDTLPTKSVGVRLRQAHAMPTFCDSLIPTYKTAHSARNVKKKS